MKPRTGLRFGLVALIAIGLTFVGGAQARADYAPQPGDIVGVGGDTPQYALSFVADGDYNGDAGFNAAGAYNRLVTFNATADANGRSAYTNSVTTEVPPRWPSTRPTFCGRARSRCSECSSSGAAITRPARRHGRTGGDQLRLQRRAFRQPPSRPQAGNQRLGLPARGRDRDRLRSRSRWTSTTNAPAGGLSVAELLGIYTGIYTTWNQLPGNSSGSTDTIIPVIPPSRLVDLQDLHRRPDDGQRRVRRRRSRPA